jgi:hypothetical protein
VLPKLEKFNGTANMVIKHLWLAIRKHRNKNKQKIPTLKRSGLAIIFKDYYSNTSSPNLVLISIDLTIISKTCGPAD